jgi:hypothetical protein
MTPRPIHVLALAAVVLLLMVLFPPYFGVYDQSGANLHTALGRHPLWSPPSQAEAYAAIHGESHDEVAAASAEERSRLVEESMAQTQVRFNKIRFAMQVVMLTLVAAVASVVPRLWRQRQMRSEG